MDLLSQIPCWYITIGIMWSILQGGRGVLEQRADPDPNKRSLQCWEKVLIHYIHAFCFCFVCTMAGFFALYVSYLLAKDASSLHQLTLGSAALLAFSFLIGVIGVGGQLPYVIVMGRLPGAPKG